MERYHPLLELAPRDVVARAITREGMDPAGETLPVYLDMRHVTNIDPRARFPGISAFLAEHKLDLRRDLIPVRPAAHYLMGGVRTDVHGRTSLPRLYAAGEVACTGVHGANRLASNSLLEGLVFGARAADAMAGEGTVTKTGSPYPKQVPRHEATDFSGPRTELQQLMWSKAGLLRDAEGLRAVAAEFPRLSRAWRGDCLTRASVEYQNLHTIGRLIVQAALAREESRGAHYRNDFPHRDDERFALHSILQKDGKLPRSIWRLDDICEVTSAAV